MDYLRANADVFSVDSASLTLAKNFTDIHGIRHLRFVQSLDGVPVLNGGVRVNIAADGRIVNVVGSPVTIVAGSAAAPRLSAEAALGSALRDVGAAVLPWTSRAQGDARRTTEFASGDRAALGLYATVEGLRLGWEAVFRSPAGLYRSVVDATLGRHPAPPLADPGLDGARLRQLPGRGGGWHPAPVRPDRERLAAGRLEVPVRPEHPRLDRPERQQPGRSDRGDRPERDQPLESATGAGRCSASSRPSPGATSGSAPGSPSTPARGRRTPTRAASSCSCC